MEEQLSKRKGRTYCDEIKQQCCELGKQGKNLSEIKNIVNGPGIRAIRRYLLEKDIQVQK
ncbi:MAG: hypothetical protein WC781_03400 [Candidatus Pacearchaeota archaeon]|jgi:hypothetical protein